MKRILFSLGLFLALVGSHAYAQIYEYEVFEAERANVTYSDCNKAIEKCDASIIYKFNRYY